MRGKRGDFFISTSRVLLWCGATFIMLSVAVSERQCYWCGPLAEQVHRSRRAPPCDDPTAHVTTCEAGLMHCAIVATSPPHVESRFCVKLYQDECYPLFCNSTKTWKITCPCRGNLCNGNNTEREIDAFVVLSKLVAKSQNARIKKRATEKSNFISSDRTIIITNMTQLQLNQTNYKVNETGKSERMIVVTSTVPEDTANEVNNSENSTMKTVEANSTTITSEAPKVFIQKLEQLNHTTKGTTVSEVIPTDAETTTTANPTTDLNVPSNAPTISDKTDSIEPSESTKSSYVVEETETIEDEVFKDPETTKEPDTTDSAEERMVKLTSNMSKPVAKPSEQLPTAEALQQNPSLSPTTTKTTEIGQADSTESGFEADNNATVQPTKGSASYIGLLPTYLYANIFALLLISH